MRRKAERKYEAIYFCWKSKPHRLYDAHGMSDVWDLSDALEAYRERIDVFFDGEWVAFYSPYPLRMTDVHFLVMDLRYGRTGRPDSYTTAMLPVIKLLFGDTWQWSLRGGQVNALTAAWEAIIDCENKWWDFLGTLGGDDKP